MRANGDNPPRRDQQEPSTERARLGFQADGGRHEGQQPFQVPRQAFCASPILIYRLDLEKEEIVDITPNCMDLFGVHPETIMQAGDAFFLERIHPDDVSLVDMLFPRLTPNEKLDDRSTIEFRLKNILGMYSWFRAILVQVGRSKLGGAGREMVVFIQDISREKTLENDNVHIQKNFTKLKETTSDALRLIDRSEIKYKSIVESMPLGLITLHHDQGSPSFIITGVNSSASSLLGLELDEKVGRDLFEVFPSLAYVPGIEFLHNPAEIDGVIAEEDFEYHDENVDGVFDIYVFRVLENSIGIIFNDASERKKAREIIENEIQRLKEIDEFRSNFISTATHELKTPLVSTCGATDYLIKNLADKLDPEALQVVQLIERGSKRMKDLIDRMLQFSMIDLGHFEMQRKRMDLVKVINESIKETEFLMKNRHHVLHVNLPPCLEIHGDPFYLGQLVTNLLTNASKNTPEKGEISISLETKPADDGLPVARIVVEDSGVGFTPEEKKMIFKKFGKIDRVSKDLDVDIQGSGLGLFISKNIVEAHGGRIWLESEGRGKGSRFFVEIPIGNLETGDS